MPGLRLKTWGKRGLCAWWGQSFRWRRAEKEGLGQKREGLPGTGQEPGKPGLRSRLGGGLMLLVTGSPAGLGGDHTEGSGMTVPLPFSRREGRAEGSHAWRARC